MDADPPERKSPAPVVAAGIGGGILFFFGCGALVLVAGAIAIYATCSHMGPIE